MDRGPRSRAGRDLAGPCAAGRWKGIAGSIRPGAAVHSKRRPRRNPRAAIGRGRFRDYDRAGPFVRSPPASEGRGSRVDFAGTRPSNRRLTPSLPPPRRIESGALSRRETVRPAASMPSPRPGPDRVHRPGDVRATGPGGLPRRRRARDARAPARPAGRALGEANAGPGPDSGPGRTRPLPRRASRPVGEPARPGPVGLARHGLGASARAHRQLPRSTCSRHDCPVAARPRRTAAPPRDPVLSRRQALPRRRRRGRRSHAGATTCAGIGYARPGAPGSRPGLD